MPTSFASIEKASRALPPEERAKLAEILLDSLRGSPVADIETAWNTEITARLEAYQRGELEVLPAESVFAEARRIAR